MDKPLWQMTLEELLLELELRHINYNIKSEPYLKEIEKEILSRVKENEK